MNNALHFMVHLSPDPARVARWSASEKLDRAGDDDGYIWHALLAASFGALAPKPFRVLHRPDRPTQVLGYTQADEPSLRTHVSQFASPDVVAALGLDRLAIKRMPDAYPAGLELGFEVRVRPTVRQDRDGDRNRARERDAFLVAVEKGCPRAQRDDLVRDDVYGDWLRQRLTAGGAELLSARIVARRRSRLSRRNCERALVSVGGHGGGGPDVVFGGVLKVRDPQAFRDLLMRGVGRHRAFGFGMLLLKPVGGG